MIGLIINPIAGLGGSVGLKGTDGSSTPKKAIEIGAKPLASERARRALEIIARDASALQFLAAEDPMGSQVIANQGGFAEIIRRTGPTSAAETTRIAGIMQDREVSLILFAGGDGTARDIVSVVGLDVPILGIPCGVKMHSGIFAVTPEAAGRLVVDLYISGQERIGFRRAEIMDIDEAALRNGRIMAELYGYARAPYSRRLLQSAKRGPGHTDEQIIAAVANEIADAMEDDILYLVGPGTSANAVLESLELEGSLLGVDAILNRGLIGRDITEQEALDLAGDRLIKIVLGVTGQQGFVLGRGNQQIGERAIRRAGKEGLIILASAEKLAGLSEPVLRIDTGNPALDQELEGHCQVHTAPRRTMMMRLEA